MTCRRALPRSATFGGRRRGGQRERAALGIPAYRPAIARVDDRAPELANPLKRRGQISDSEVRKGSGIAGTAPTTVDSEAQAVRLARPSRSGRGRPWRELYVENAVPEAARAIGIVGREFDQGRGHGRQYGRRSRLVWALREEALAVPAALADPSDHALPKCGRRVEDRAKLDVRVQRALELRHVAAGLAE